MAKVYYAVVVGRKPGIYDNLEDFKKQINEYPGGKGNSFLSKQEAENYIKDAENKMYYVVVNNKVQKIYETQKAAKKGTTKKNKKIFHVRGYNNAKNLLEKKKNSLLGITTSGKYYIVVNGRTKKIFKDYEEAKKHTSNKYKKIYEANSREEAERILKEETKRFKKDTKTDKTKYYIVVNGAVQEIFTNQNEAKKNTSNNYKEVYTAVGKEAAEKLLKRKIKEFENNTNIKFDKQKSKNKNSKEFYAVKIGRNPGIYRNEQEFNKQLRRYPNALGKKFKTLKEAENFLNQSVKTSERLYYIVVNSDHQSIFRSLKQAQEVEPITENIIEVKGLEEAERTFERLKTINEKIKIEAEVRAKVAKEKAMEEENFGFVIEKLDKKKNNTKEGKNKKSNKSLKLDEFLNDKEIIEDTYKTKKHLDKDIVDEVDNWFVIVEGRELGVVDSRLKAELATVDYSGGLYYSFKCKELAENYWKAISAAKNNNILNNIVKGKDIRLDRLLLRDAIQTEDKKFFNSLNYKISNPDKVATAYVDGSYSYKKGQVGSGVVYIVDNLYFLHSSFVSQKGEEFELSSAFAEIRASIIAIEAALEQKKEKIIIHHDYIFIDVDETQTISNPSKLIYAYRQYLESVSPLIDIEFVKVKAHNGDKLNEVADKIAHIRNIQQRINPN